MDAKDTPPLTTHVETDIAHGLHQTDATGAVMPAIQPSTTYARGADNQLLNSAHAYTRDQNPTYALAEQMLARLEGAAQARLFASGMSAATAVFRALQPGAHIVAPQVMYWGLRNWLVDFCEQWGLALTLFDASDANALATTLDGRRADVVWIETPTNPTWQIIDIRAAADVAHRAGALLAVDSTVATPVHTQPLAYGADIVMHSATKALNGHSDVLAGALACRDADAPLWQRIMKERGEGGAVPGPFEAWLLQRGMRTLFVRMQRASASALHLAQQLESHSAIEVVHYPGLKSHAGHAVALRQMRNGFANMMSIEVRGGSAAALRVSGALRVFSRATSLGGVESLVEHRASIEGADSPIPANLLRLSIGIEHVDDLLADLNAALEHVCP